MAATLSPNDILYFALPYIVSVPFIFQDPTSGEDQTGNNNFYHYRVVCLNIGDPLGGLISNAVILDQGPGSKIHP